MDRNTAFIDEVIAIFEVIEDKTFMRVDNVLFFQNNGKIRLGSRILSSILKTFQTIKFALSQHSISDVYVLLRKVRDDAILFIILLGLIEKYNEDSVSDKHISTPKALTEDEVAAWFKSKLKSSKKLSYSGFMAYFKENEVINNFIELFYKQRLKRWSQILNDHVHGNSYLSYCDNNYYGNRLDEEIREIVFGLTSFSLSMLILVDPSYIASSDYGDYCNHGLTPPIGSQYWVDLFFTDFMNKRMNKEEVEYLRKHQKYEMEF